MYQRKSRPAASPGPAPAPTRAPPHGQDSHAPTSLGHHVPTGVDRPAYFGRGIAPPSALRSRVESAIGQDLSDVRLHTGPEASTLARNSAARAFTIGRDVGFAAGAFRPGTPEGDELLAHELVHAAQQQGGGTEGPLRMTDPGEPLERQADAIAGALVAGHAPRVRPWRTPPVFARQLERHEDVGRGLGAEDVTRWAEASYWEQRLLEAYPLSIFPTERFAAQPDERDAILSVVWEIHRAVAPVRTRLERLVRIRARGTGSVPAVYQIVFLPPATPGGQPRLEITFITSGAATTAQTAPQPPARFVAPALTMTTVAFPGDDPMGSFFRPHPEEADQLRSWIADQHGPIDQMLTTRHGRHSTLFHVSRTGPQVVIRFLGSELPTATPVPAGYAGRTFGELQMERLQARTGADRLGRVNGLDRIPADERLAVQVAIWAYFDGGTRSTEVDAIVSIPGQPVRRVFYTLRFQPRSNNVDVVRIGDEGGTRAVRPSAFTFDVQRSPDFAANSATVSALGGWLGRRYPGLGASGTTVAALVSEANRRIASAASTPAFFATTYGMEVLSARAAVTRMTTAHGRDAGQTAGMRDFSADDLRLLELAFETLSMAMVQVLRGVKLVRQRVLLERRATPRPGGGEEVRYAPDATVGGLATQHITRRGGTVISQERTISIFDAIRANDDRLFVGGALVLPISADAVLHEVGHLVGEQASIQAEFNRTFVDAGARLRTAPPTSYAGRETGEFFPEAFALYQTDPEWLRTNIPAMYRWIDVVARTGAPPASRGRAAPP